MKNPNIFMKTLLVSFIADIIDKHNIVEYFLFVNNLSTNTREVCKLLRHL